MQQSPGRPAPRALCCAFRQLWPGRASRGDRVQLQNPIGRRRCSSRSTAGSWRSCSRASCSGRRSSGSWAGRSLSHHRETLARAVRRRPGCAAHPRRPHPRVRPRDGRRPVRRRAAPPSSTTPTRSVRPTCARRRCRSRYAASRCRSTCGTRTRASRLSQSVPGSSDRRSARSPRSPRCSAASGAWRARRSTPSRRSRRPGCTWRA